MMSFTIYRYRIYLLYIHKQYEYDQLSHSHAIAKYHFTIEKGNI
jgi:hypothetical protein